MKNREAAKAQRETVLAERVARLRRDGQDPKAVLEDAAREGLDVRRIKKLAREVKLPEGEAEAEQTEGGGPPPADKPKASGKAKAKPKAHTKDGPTPDAA